MPFLRSSDTTAQRLGRALLGYLVAITLIITLAPFRFADHPVHGLSDLWDWSDVIMNIVMFVPLGFVYQLTRPAGIALRVPTVLLLGAALSACIEGAQLFAVTRFTSLVDISTNAIGAAVGAWGYTMVMRRIEGASTVRSMALELPLMGLIYLLVPLVWLAGLASADGPRAWLVLPIVAFASGIIGTVHAAYLQPSRNVGHFWLLVAAAGWYVIALLPGTIRQWNLLAAGATIALGVAWLRSLATQRYRERHASRRFELPTLRLVLPLFAGYLALSSLWPLTATDGMWQYTTALIASVQPTKTDIFVALEHVSAFTLVGYIIAEFHGRDLPRYRQIAARVLLWSGGLSVMLEGARGVHPLYRFSVPMLACTTFAALFGGWIYQLQREHVRALLRRRMAPTASAVDAISETSRETSRACDPTSSDRDERILSVL